ncbi:MAG TPA: GHKL domain-containing protein [Clostridiales bacterium]|nr:GHKL domain-containing protein [Clostridiales bacterium]
MTLPIGIEILLDGALLFLISFGIFNERHGMKIKDSLLALYFTLSCTVSRLSVSISMNTAPLLSMEKQGYEIVPAPSLILFLFLILIVIIINSLWFKKDAVYTLFGTMAVFSIFIIVREMFILLFYGLGTADNSWNPVICRIGSVLLLCAVLFTPFFKWIQDKLNDGLLPVKLLIGNTMVLLCALLVFLDFDATKTTDQLLFLSVTIAAILLINLLFGAYAQKRSAEIKRVTMLEQYIPVIEELITQVRARQHEFNNRLLAISAAAQTADNLEQAQAEIAELTTGLQLDISEKSLLGCDSKIIAGMIFSKMKYAEMKKIMVISNITAPLKGRAIRELDVVEIVGILIDNAIEASNAGDTIYIKIEHSDDGLSVLVSNPYMMQSATDFVRMFRRGFSTKGENDTRGHGLANVKAIVDRYRGKIITRNETVHHQNYVTIGVIFP